MSRREVAAPRGGWPSPCACYGNQQEQASRFKPWHTRYKWKSTNNRSHAEFDIRQFHLRKVRISPIGKIIEKQGESQDRRIPGKATTVTDKSDHFEPEINRCK
ncbi:MAG: hypothetical protein WBB85_10490 [Albidovulum sp.]|uniref:hypothetical protein n=1 Tax=Albidovulum sp. TaxID=1872424 RepID=UPI003CAEBE02